MKLYIVRHAVAVSKNIPGPADSERPLTEDGMADMRVGAVGLRGIGVRPKAILSSPLVRARQTAEILARELCDGNAPIRITEFLSPDGKLEQVYREIHRERRLESIMLVGHEPSLGEIAGSIVWGSPEYAISLKKGGACAIDLERISPPPRGALLFLVTPGILRALAR